MDEYGLPEAQYALSKLLLSDDPEIHDPDEGIHWLKQAAENSQASGWQVSPEDYEAIDRASREFTEGLPHYTLFFNTNTAD